MRIEDRIICLCTRQEFGEQHQEQLQKLCSCTHINWAYLYEVADGQGISPLVYYNLTKSQDLVTIPADILQRFKKAYMQNVIVKKNSSEILEKILAFIAPRGLLALLLKGAALDIVVYHQPWYTRMRDVDLVLRSNQIGKSVAEFNDVIDFIEKFNHNAHIYKVHIEYDEYTHHDMTMNGLIAIDPVRTWQDARLIRYRNQEVLILSVEDLLLASVINSCRKRYFNLKSLCDIASIIERYPNLDWKSFTQKANCYRCNTISYTALVVCQKTLGCKIPAGLQNGLQVSPFRSSIIQELVTFLLERKTFAELTRKTRGLWFGRELSWGLAVTYISYRPDQVFPKLGEVQHTWRAGSPVR